MRPLAAALLILSASVLAGCGRAEQAEADFQVEQRIAATRAGLSLDRAKEIVAKVDGVDPADVTVMHRSVDPRTATILAAVPAAEEMLSDDPVETIDLRWDLRADLPLMVMWSERGEFGPREAVTQEEAEAIARDLLQRWVPEEVGEIEGLTTQKLLAPFYVVNWVGMTEGHLTGDHAMVQVSSVTGLPILFRQRIARQRPSPGDIRITRDEALDLVRGHLRREGFTQAETVELVARLTLSAEMHPRAGPAWLVALIGPTGRQQQVIPVDAMTGEIIARNAGWNDDTSSDTAGGTDG